MSEIKKCPICDSNVVDGECDVCGYNEDMSLDEIEDCRQDFEDNAGCGEDYDWEMENENEMIDFQDPYDIEYDR